MSVAVAHQINKASDVVLAAAVTEAALRGTRLVVLHVVTSKDLDTEEVLRQGIGDLVSAAVAAQGAGDLEWEVRVETSEASTVDDTARAILDAVDRAGVDLLVIGARRRSAVGKAFLGSVTQEILLDSSIPVLVVKGSAS
ncbi:MAG TPA: universal stress protein [Ornithinibacter sp.]|nr:universal stress protein [Ornithinibacter sp.]